MNEEQTRCRCGRRTEIELGPAAAPPFDDRHTSPAGEITSVIGTPTVRDHDLDATMLTDAVKTGGDGGRFVEGGYHH